LVVCQETNGGFLERNLFFPSFLLPSLLPLPLLTTSLPFILQEMDIVEEVCRKGCAQSGWPLTLSQLHELVTQKLSKMKLAELKSHVEALQTQGKL